MKKAKEKEALLKSSPELRENYERWSMASFAHGTYGEDPEEKNKDQITSRIQQIKEKILFQFLFDSLINFDEKSFLNDMKLLPGIEDELVADDSQIWAWIRTQDLSRYFTVKLDLADILNKLCEIDERLSKSKEWNSVWKGES